MKTQDSNNKFRNKLFSVKQILILIGLGFIFIACEKKVEQKKNKKLIGFKSEWIGELGDENYEAAEPLAESKKIDVKQVDDILIVKSWQFTNT